MRFIEFEPIYKERIWGGRRLEKSLGRKLPEGNAYGESWDIVDRDEDQSVVASGPWKGLTIRELLRGHGAAIMGPKWPVGRSFPILVKWLDCREDLSLQVHPPKGVAERLGGESKTENWYVAEADEGARICIGLKSGLDRESLEQALKEGAVEEALNWVVSQPGYSMFIPSGQFHAIGGGNFILEIQENSDTTYRVWDWGRVGLDGKPRELHMEEALESVNFSDNGRMEVFEDERFIVLVDCEEFRIRKRVLNGDRIALEAKEEPRIVSVVEGTLKLRDREGVSMFKKGANILLPFEETFSLESDSGCTILITDRFL